jgi:hypothetical protein
MSTCSRLNFAKTERKHPDPTVIQDSAAASQTLNIALKKEELCIAINRKAEDLPRLTQQDFRSLAEHATDVLRAERLGLLDGSDVNPDVSPVTLADNIDVNPRSKRQRVWHLWDPATVDNYSRDGHKLLKLHTSEKDGDCGK